MKFHRHLVCTQQQHIETIELSDRLLHVAARHAHRVPYTSHMCCFHSRESTLHDLEGGSECGDITGTHQHSTACEDECTCDTPVCACVCKSVYMIACMWLTGNHVRVFRCTEMDQGDSFRTWSDSQTQLQTQHIRTRTPTHWRQHTNSTQATHMMHITNLGFAKWDDPYTSTTAERPWQSSTSARYGLRATHPVVA